MSRLSDNEMKSGQVWNGYDYDRQCWVVDGVVQRCGHPDHMDCQCYGKANAGLVIVLKGLS